MTRQIPLNGVAIPIGARILPVRNNGLHIRLSNGITVSLQWGPGYYSDNLAEFEEIAGFFDLDAVERFDQPRSSVTAELAAWTESDRWITREYPKAEGENVLGWQDAEGISRFIAWAAAYFEEGHDDQSTD